MSDQWPKRKVLRHPYHDYNGGAYFVTVCVKDHRCVLGSIQNGVMHRSDLGEYLDMAIRNITDHCKYADIPVWIVMPNHFHAVVLISSDGNIRMPDVGVGGFHSRLATVIGRIKGSVTRYARSKDLHFEWQSRYHDHIMRDPMRSREIVEYIRTNPIRWSTDRYNPESR